MEKKLPEGWVEVSIQEIGSIVTGNTPSKKFPEYYGAAVPWVKPGDIKKSRISIETEEYLSDLGKKQARIIPEGSVMVTCIGDLGNVSVAGVELATNQQINSIVPDVGIAESKYVYYAALTLKPWLEEAATSTTISMVNKSNFSKAPILLPPLPEQKRIAAKLDELFGHLDVLKTKLDRIPALLKNFRQQVLNQAVTGKLTEEWRKGKDLGEWKNCKLSELIIDRPRNGFSPKGVDFETDVKSLTLSATTTGSFDPRYVKYLDIEKPSPDSHLWLKSGDILIQRSNSLDYVGTSAIYTGDDFEFIYPDLMMKIRANNLILTEYLYFFLSSEQSKEYFKANASGTAGNMPKINQGVVQNTPVRLPSLLEQQEIVQRVEGLFAVADKIEAQYNSLKTKIDTLPQTILNKAFKGELVPQNPNDEPASVLLERVKKEKTSKNSVKKSASKTKLKTEPRKKVKKQEVEESSTDAIKIKNRIITQTISDILDPNPVEAHLFRFFRNERFTIEDIPETLKNEYERLRMLLYQALENEAGIDGSRLTLEWENEQMYFRYNKI